MNSSTIFERTYKPLTLWFAAAWEIVSQKNGLSALGLRNALEVGTYPTA